MVYLGKEPFRRYYFAHKSSCATAFCVLVYAAFVVIPIFLGLATNNFWPAQLEYTEQPIFKYRDEAIILNYQNGAVLGYSSVTALNDMFSDKIISPSVKASAIDKNNDGKPEKFHFEITFNSDTSTLTMSQIYLFFDVALTNKVNLQMQDYIKFNVNSANGISGATISGNIEFNQNMPLQSSTIIRNVYNTSVFDEPLDELDAISLEERKMRRNETITCNCQMSVISGQAGTKSKIVIDLDLPISQPIWYIPTLFQNLKFAWIQYIYLLLPIYFLLDWILRFAYRNKLFYLFELNDLPDSKKYN